MKISGFNSGNIMYVLFMSSNAVTKCLSLLQNIIDDHKNIILNLEDYLLKLLKRFRLNPL